MGGDATVRRGPWSLGWTYRGLYGIGLACLLATGASNLAIPFLLRRAFDGLEAGEPRSYLLTCALLMAGVALARMLVRTISRICVLGASRRVMADLREVVFRHLQRLPVSWFDATPTGDTVSRIIGDLAHVRSLFGPVVLNLTNTFALYAAALVLLVSLDPLLAFAALVPQAALAVVVRGLSKRTFRESTRAQQELARISSRLAEVIEGLTVLRAAAQERVEGARLDGLAEGYCRAQGRFARNRSYLVAVMGLVAAGGQLCVLALGGRQVMAGHLSLGDFVAFTSALAMLSWPTIALGWVLNALQRGRAALARIDTLLEQEPEPADDRVDRTADETTRGQSLTVRNLRHGFDADAPPVLDGLDFSLPAGGLLGLVGPPGAGKSTLLSILAGLRPTEPGKVLRGDVDLASLAPSRAREGVGLVSQEPFLFSRSLGDNVRYGRPGDQDAERLRRSVVDSGLEDDLVQLPDGLDTVVGERGVTLSGGQRQRATLARALHAEPSLLLLDDSLSAVDAVTETAILASLRRRRAEGGWTELRVASRLTAVVECDEILVLDRGRVIDRGRHDELIEREGWYSRTWQEQERQRELEELA
ncbi:MAG: ABC transporter ATP-binding protein [Acidobacteriota bacterium]